MNGRFVGTFVFLVIVRMVATAIPVNHIPFDKTADWSKSVKSGSTSASA